MGIFKAMGAAVSGVSNGQFKSFFYCESMDMDTIMIRGQRHTSEYDQNQNTDANCITDGSIVSISDGQCAITVSGGKVSGICFTPGEHVFSSEHSVSVFSGSGLKKITKEAWRRFTYGGDPGYTPERIYFINTKEKMGNRFVTENPIPFRVVDDRIGMDVDASLVCSGMFSYRIAKPDVIYKRLAGNASRSYTFHELNQQLVPELNSCLTYCISQISSSHIRRSQLPASIENIEKYFMQLLTGGWINSRGIELVNLSFDVFDVTGADGWTFTLAQRDAMYAAPEVAEAYGLLSKQEGIAAQNE